MKPDKRKYFPFPISLMRGQGAHCTPWEDSRSLLEDAVCVSICQLAEKEDWGKDSDWDQVDSLADLHCRTNCGCARRHLSEKHQRILAASAYLKVPWLSGTCKDHADACETRATPYAAGGTLCRLSADLLWRIHAEQWDLNRLRFLVAVYAGIGKSRWQWLAYSRLKALAAGFDSAAAVTPDAVLPTDKVARYWSNRLHEQGFYGLVLDGQKRIYSHKCGTDEQLLREYREATKRRNRPEVLRVSSG